MDGREEREEIFKGEFPVPREIGEALMQALAGGRPPVENGARGGMVRNGCAPGMFVIGLPSADRYTQTKEGVLCYVSNTAPNRTEGKSDADLCVIPLIEKNLTGRETWVDSTCFKPVAVAAVEELAIKTRQRVADLAASGLKVGDPVEFIDDYLMAGRKDDGGTEEYTIRRGCPAVLEAIGLPGHENKGPGHSGAVSRVQCGRYMLSDLVPPAVRIFIFEAGCSVNVPANKIAKKGGAVRERLFVPDSYLNRIIACCKRVTERETHDRIQKDLGLPVLGRGQGAVILLVGPPGTGKTKTAEMVATILNKPLLRSEAMSIMSPEKLAHELSDEFKKCHSVSGVLLLDDVGAYLKKRGDHPVTDEITAVFLRGLEESDGIVFLTANVMGAIDPAIFSRCHVILQYEKLERDIRRKLWEALLSGKLADSLIGDEARREAMYDELSLFELDGREIETAVYNAIRRTLWENGGKRPDGMAKWIRTKAIVEEAQLIAQNKQQM